LEESIRQQAYAAEQASKNAANEARWAADAAEHRARLAAEELEWSRPTRERTWQEKEADRLHEKRAEEQEWRNKVHRRSEELRRYAGLTPRQREVERKKEIARYRKSPGGSLRWERLLAEEVEKRWRRWRTYLAIFVFSSFAMGFCLAEGVVGLVGFVVWFITLMGSFLVFYLADQHYHPWLYKRTDDWLYPDD